MGRGIRFRVLITGWFEPAFRGDEKGFGEAVERAIRKIFDNMAFLRDNFEYDVDFIFEFEDEESDS